MAVALVMETTPSSAVAVRGAGFVSDFSTRSRKSCCLRTSVMLNFQSWKLVPLNWSNLSSMCNDEFPDLEVGTVELVELKFDV
jgi:Tfp pilus tip-associated adhesin PilY1